MGLFLAMPCKNVFKEKIITKHNIQETHIHIFHNRLTGRIRYKSAVVSDFPRFNQNSTGADALMPTKVILTKKFGMKTSTK